MTTQTQNKSNEINITRVYDAPVKMVWDAWTDTDQVGQWWGPRGFTITTHSKDFKPGGIWHYTMHSPDGTDYPNKTKYLEIEDYSYMVYDHGGYDDREPIFRVKVSFTDLNGKTKMDMTMTLPTPEAAKETRKFIKEANGNSTWDRLAEYVEKEISGKDQFVINRSFDAPIETLFELWINPSHLSKWLAPTGMNMEFIRSNINVGGDSFYFMSNGENLKMYGKINYLEIEKPNHIKYTQQFCDENENISRHPMSPVWPETMLTDVRFMQEGENKTRVTVTWQCYGNTTTEELNTFIEAKTGMSYGWNGSFDKLDDYLEKNESLLKV